MNRVAWRSIRAHVKQFALTTFAVVLGVAFLSGTLALRAVLSNTFSDLVSSTVTADLYVIGQRVDDRESSTDVQTHPVDASLAEVIGQVDGVDTAHPEASTPGVLVGADDTPVTSSGAPTIIHPLHEGRGTATVLEGRRPQGGSEIALESGALERSGLKVGDATHIVIQGQPMDVTVVGEYTFGAERAGAVLVGMDPDWLIPTVAPDGNVTTIAITLEEGASVTGVKDNVARILPGDLRLQTRQQTIDEQNGAIERTLGFVQTFLLVFVVLAMFVGSFIIMNSFAMSVRQRVKEFALLRAVGASPASVFGVVFCQALVIGAMGSAVGIVAGAGLLKAVVALLDALGMPLTDGVPMTPAIITISMIVGILVTVVGALMPAREAALTHPVEAMREVGGAREKSLVARTIIGSLILSAGIAAAATAWIQDDLDQRRVVLGVGAGAIIVGLLIVSPVLARPVVGLIGLPLRLLRPSGRLAVRNIIHNPRRTANTSGALMVGMALVCAGATLASSVNTSISDEVNTSMKADLLIQSAAQSSGAQLSPEMAQELTQIDGVASSDRFTYIIASAAMPDGTEDPTALVNIVNPQTYNDSFDLDLRAGSLEDMDATHVAAYEDSGLTVGETVTLTGPNGSVEATVAAIIDPEGIGGQFYATPDTAALVGSWITAVPPDPEHVLDSPIGMFLTLQEGANLQTVREKAQDILAPTYQYSAYNAEEVSDQVGQSVDQILGILYGLLGLSIAIAILGIVNTLVLSVAERTREIGLMRAVGLGRAQLAGQIMVESVLTALYGTVLGGATGIALAAALRKILEDDGLTALSIPWGQMIVLLIISVLVGIIAALWPALRASRIPVLDAIATE